eukprot:1139250-Pelagomonas_calceolata.AAC.4
MMLQRQVVPGKLSSCKTGPPACSAPIRPARHGFARSVTRLNESALAQPTLFAPQSRFPSSQVCSASDAQMSLMMGSSWHFLFGPVARHDLELQQTHASAITCHQVLVALCMLLPQPGFI